MHAQPLSPSDCVALLAQADAPLLRERLHALLSAHGQVCRLDLVHTDQGQMGRVLCFVRMSSTQEEQAVARALGLGRFGGDLVMVLRVPPPGLEAASRLV